MKHIKQWVKQYNKEYRRAELWREALRQREEKKLAYQQDVVETQVFVQAPIGDMTNSKTVFSRGDLGHNGEEANQIKKLYNELESLPLSPRFAL